MCPTVRVRALAGEEGSTGMLVVEAVVPGGPSDGALEAGDVLVALEGRIVVHFQATPVTLRGIQSNTSGIGQL